MTLYDYRTANLPKYDKQMYRDGYTPEDILMAMRRDKRQEREE